MNRAAAPSAAPGAPGSNVSPDHRQLWPDLGWAALLAAATVLAYAPALRGGILWDDDAHLTQPVLQSLDGLRRIWVLFGATQQYYPILHSAFWVEHRLWGDAVLGYHLANLLEHILAAGLVVCLMRRLALPGAWLGGFLFALHPVAVESVAWISEQKNTLSAVFYLASAVAYLRFDRTRRPAAYVLALACFVLALLTKTVTATLPAALWVVIWWRRGRIDPRRDGLPLLPWLALGAGAGAFTAWMERAYIGAQGADFALSPAQRVLIAGRALWFYGGKLIWPSNLIFIYPRWHVDPAAVGPWLCPLGAIAVCAALAWLARRTRGPLAGGLYFAGTLFPALGFLNVYPFLFSFVADHFQYLARIGVLVPGAVGLTRLVEVYGSRCMTHRGHPDDPRRIVPDRPVARWLKPCLGALLLLPLGVLTWRTAHNYRDADTLNRSVLARNPDCWLAHYNLGTSLEARPGGLPVALAEYRETVRLEPGFADGHNNLAGALFRVNGDWAGAFAEYREALRLRPADAEAHSNLGNLLALVPERRAEAIAEYREALRLDPELAQAHFNLGNALAASPATRSEAIAEYRAALRIRPDYFSAAYNLGVALTNLPERIQEAVDAFRRAVRIEPDNAQAHQNLGIVLQRLPGQRTEARAELMTALRLNPNLPAARAHLAQLDAGL
jgi:tetratricopeptide (TPR) repeat protein